MISRLTDSHTVITLDKNFLLYIASKHPTKTKLSVLFYYVIIHLNNINNHI